MTSKSGRSPLVAKELSAEPLGARDVRVAVKAIGVNPADWKMRDALGVRLAHELLGAAGPFVCGIDFAGIVIELGPNAEGVEIGERVVGAVDLLRRRRGSYASEVVVRDARLARIPKGIDFATAACLPVAGVTAHMALFEQGGLDRLAKGRVLVLGASGGVGHLAVQLAKSYGADVFGVCSARNAPLVARLGATPIDYTHGNVIAVARAHGPYDVVVNAVGTDRYPIPYVARMLKPHGCHVLVVPAPLDFPYLALPRVKTLLTRATRETLEPLLTAMAEKKLEVVIAERIPLAEAERAHQRSREGRVAGKLVLTND